MTCFPSLIVALSLLGVVGGCGQEQGPSDRGRVELLADASALPKSEQLAVLAETRKAIDDTWMLYGLPGASPDISTTKHAVLFAGLGESSTCRLEYDGYRVESVSREIRIELQGDWPRECVDDLNPRTFVLAIPKSELPRGRLQVVTERGDKLAVERRR